jgi:glycine cleavage system H protein
MPFPADYRYTREHEWLKVDGNQATIGITDYAQNSLGDIVFVELPKVGDELSAGKSFGTVESVKAVSELFAPASGKVVAINDELATSPEKINSAAHDAWMVRIQLANPGEADKLLSAADYDNYVKEEGGH